MKATVVLQLLGLVALLQEFKASEVTVPAIKTTPIKCENAGIFDGIKCICLNNFFGHRCEVVIDRVIIGKIASTTMEVGLTVTNYPYTPSMSDITSNDYKKFETTFKAHMKLILSSIMTDVRILKLSESSVVGTSVKYEVLMDIPYNKTVSIIVQYEQRYSKVVTLLKDDQCKTDSLCIDGNSVSATLIHPLSEEARCARNISSTYLKFFDPVVTNEGLVCVSNCQQESPHYYNCTAGSCYIQETGPQCFCPRTNLYLYTYSRCRGAILKSAMYGGVGAAIAVLLIAIVILGVFLYRKKYYY